MRAQTLTVVDDAGYVKRRIDHTDRLRACANIVMEGSRAAVALARRPPSPVAWTPLRPAHKSLSLSILILTYNRPDALRRTFEALRAQGRSSCVTVVDNGSPDGAPNTFMFPEVRMIALDENLGVEAFSRAAAEADGDVLLILDDDAIPDEHALTQAMALLEERPEIGAVAMHPVNLTTGRSEWGFARRTAPTDAFPFMGCANLVRADCWRAVGGYEGGFFLYRNDTDLAMSLLDLGSKVYFDPAWIVRHDSPMGKADRWFELATRNWIWMMRRHGRGMSTLAAIALGWAHAHRLAGARASLHMRVLKGVWHGVTRRPPPLAPRIRPTGRSVRQMLALRIGR